MISDSNQCYVESTKDLMLFSHTFVCRLYISSNDGLIQTLANVHTLSGEIDQMTVIIISTISC